MKLPDLPEPQTKDQSIIHAKAYSEAIANLPQMQQIKTDRIRLNEMQAPDWFIHMVDIEIDFILWRIDYLGHHSSAGDTRTYAADTLQYMRVVMDMMRNFLRPDRMYWRSIKRATEWLSDERELVKVGTTG